MAFEAIAVGVGGLVVGGLVFVFARDPLEELGHNGEAGAENYGCEFTHAISIVSIMMERIGLHRRWGTHFHRPTLMIEYVPSEV